MLATPIRRRAGLVAAIALLAIASPLAGVSAVPAGAQPASYTLDVSPGPFVDGQAVDITVRAGAGKRLAFSGLVYVCRADGTYATTDDLNPIAGNCPPVPLSSSGSPLPSSIVAYPDGSTSVTRLRVGTGTAQWGPAEDPTRFSLTCDPSNPCRLVVSTLLSSQRIIDSSTLLTFADTNPIGACGGTEPDAPTAAGPDRLTGAWIDLTRAKCQATGSKVSTQSVFAGEGDGHRAYASGLADFTYSAVGPTFTRPSAAATRSSVSVPIGVNAVVIGVLGGYATTETNWPSGVAKPFDDVQVTMGEMATLFGKDPFAFDATYASILRDRNPEMQRAPLVSSLKNVPLAAAGADATSWFATSAFDTLAPSEWTSSPIGVDGNTPNAPRGVHESFALADPPFSISFVELYSSLGQIKRTAAQSESAPGQYGPIWILTDLATAREIGIPTVALQNSSGAFVEPTDESLLAAVPDLQLQADGTYLPQVGTPSSSPSAYPLTFVEHAVVPTEPLLDTACVARTATQQILAGWLAYVTGAGQAELPDGVVALPPALAAQAARAQSVVGTAALTGPCAPAPPPVVPPVPPAESGAPGAPSASSFPSGDLPFSSFDGVGSPGGGPSSGAGGGSGSFAAGSGGPGEAALVGADGIAGTDDDITLAEIAYPDPTGGGAGNGAGTALALVVLAVLVAVGGWLSSGRRVELPGRSRS